MLCHGVIVMVIQCSVDVMALESLCQCYGGTVQCQCNGDCVTVYIAMVIQCRVVLCCECHSVSVMVCLTQCTLNVIIIICLNLQPQT